MNNDIELLNLMMDDQADALEVHKPGPYWERKCLTAARNIRQFGLDRFRDPAHGIVISQTEAASFDIRLHLGVNRRAKIARLLLSKPPLQRAIDAQTAMALSIYRERQALFEALMGLSPRAAELLARWELPNRCGYGEINSCRAFGKTFVSESLLLLDVHDHIAQTARLEDARSFAEIGGGYGAYADIVITNLPNVRKVLLVDVAPNLYITYEFMKDVFGNSVRDYRACRDAENIHFRDDDQLEILVLAPHLAEKFTGTIDYFHNKDSFVEMPIDVVGNYSAMVARWLQPTSVVALTSYHEYDLATTYAPDVLKDLFHDQNFLQFDKESLLPDHANRFYVSMNIGD